jgi:MoCo/4Fe-4S cofactor protein with predicted Tat translocation signal
MSARPNPAAADHAAFVEALHGKHGPAYWRSLEQLSNTLAFRRYVAAAFPQVAEGLESGLDRRDVLRVMAASLMLGGLAACGPEVPPEKLRQPVIAPEGIVPGGLRRYSSAVLLDGYATGVLVRHEGVRPIKVEGNPLHPASLGATDPYAEAAILDLYDPDRAQAITSAGRVRTWDALATTLSGRVAALQDRRGVGLRILTGTVTSPLLAAQLAALQAAFPDFRWHQWQAITRDNPRTGAMLAYGKPFETIPHLDRADVMLAIGGDLFSTAPGRLRFARDFAAGRDPVGRRRMSRLYAVESTPTLVGAAADHRFVLAPSEIERFLRALAAALGAAPKAWAWTDGPAWQAALAQDLAAHRGRALVHIGAEQPAFLHALAHRINQALGAPGATLSLIPSAAAAPTNQATSLRDLVTDMSAERVDTLLIFGGNPVFTAPADLGFADALGRVGLSVALGTHRDETGVACRWHVPEAHIFERWTDARAFDGTTTIVQPQVQPFYDGRSAHALVAQLLTGDAPNDQALLQQLWRKRWGGHATQFTQRWHEALQQGLVADTAESPVSATPRDDFLAEPPPMTAAPGAALNVLFRADDGLWDGRFANNGWLQELPRPFTKLTWDNAALIAPATAERLGLVNEDLVELRAGSRSVRLPIWALPGQAVDCITLPLGFGRRAVGRVGKETGTDVYPLRRLDALWTVSDVTLTKLDARKALATTQLHHLIADERPVRRATLTDFLRAPQDAAGAPPPQASFYPRYPESDTAWGMTIDTGMCIGCNACVVACQAENNIPVVGKEQVLRGREMQWLRIDLYYSGAAAEPAATFQPVPCMHCEDAPCEVVCPVGATSHDAEGLNVMVYNRCIGTRFCSNNCPYKVRRFNFLDFTETEARSADARNADVTVRGRGVMEKCTYCIQRIAEARITADREDRPIKDGEVVTACQAACPTRAIVFGNLRDPNAAVAKKKQSPLNYALLDDLNTRPRTTYAARLDNLNPDLAKA